VPCIRPSLLGQSDWRSDHTPAGEPQLVVCREVRKAVLVQPELEEAPV
jgi:hypothetical protein